MNKLQDTQNFIYFKSDIFVKFVPHVNFINTVMKKFYGNNYQILYDISQVFNLKLKNNKNK